MSPDWILSSEILISSQISILSFSASFSFSSMSNANESEIEADHGFECEEIERLCGLAK